MAAGNKFSRSWSRFSLSPSKATTCCSANGSIPPLRPFDTSVDDIIYSPWAPLSLGTNPRSLNAIIVQKFQTIARFVFSQARVGIQTQGDRTIFRAITDKD